MTPFDIWHNAVKERPQTFKLGEHYWLDIETGWKVWVSSGRGFYKLISPNDGEITISFLEKFRMKSLLTWWTTGAMQVRQNSIIVKDIPANDIESFMRQRS